MLCHYLLSNTMDKELKELILSKDRYNDFTILDNPVSFKDLFKDRDYDVVQVHDTTLFSYEDGEKDIVGFSGVFEKEGYALPYALA